MKLNYLAAAFLIGVGAYAQDNNTVKGYIYDSANNNEPLAYATVMLQNTSFGAEADENGYFEIECDAGSYLLEASYMGYQTYVMPYETGNPQNVSINLLPQDDNLEEIVINVNNRKSSETALLGEQRLAQKSFREKAWVMLLLLLQKPPEFQSKKEVIMYMYAV
jgi:hypothetical protein